MRPYLLCIVLFAIILTGCSKKEEVMPKPPGGTGIVDGTAPGLSVAGILQSNMVIQRDQPFKVWGLAPAKTTVEVDVSWNQTVFNTVADASGNWSLTIPAAAVNTTPQTITAKASGFKETTLSNILIGDVWLCSGQSNMAMPVDSIAPFTGVLNFRSEIAAANYPMIRTLAIQEDAQPSPITSLTYPVVWQICSPSTVGQTSAIAYYFAQQLNTTLNVPIGIIVSAVNGSFCQDWANAEAIVNDGSINSGYAFGSTYYNGMINPLLNLSLKGFIWYQGENNQHDDPVSGYTKLNTDLINGWRTKFNQPSLPFYYVQLTPFAEDYNSTTPPGGDLVSDYLAKFREAQANILPATTGTGMAITMDVGEAKNHHPRNKKPVGQRLAFLALKNTYKQNVQCYGPHYTSFSVNGATAIINFSSGTADGLNTISGLPLKQYFFVAGADHVFHQATASITGNTITVQASPAFSLPIQAVRYAFTNAPVTNLQNSAGLPAEPFRTDNWDN